MTDDNFPIRLTGGAAQTEGLVEIFVLSQWGTVCIAGWTEGATSVVCRQLGFYGRNASYGVQRPQDSQPVVFSNTMNCRGDENSLADCALSGWDANYCSNGRTIKVFCQIGKK